MFSLILLSALPQATSQAPMMALHVAVQRDFTFLESTRTTAVEYWISGERTHEKRGEQVRIVRGDLGLTWVIDPRKGAYYEQRRPVQAPAAAPGAAPSEDLHTVGFDYEPEFIWEVKDTGEGQSLLGRDCRLTVATGVAEFAETTLRLWFCPSAGPKTERPLNDLVLGLAGFPFRDIGAFVTSQLARRPEALLLRVEATTDPAISPLMVHKVQVGALQTATPPPGIFELPEGLRQAPRE